MTLTRWQRPVGFALAPWRLRYALHQDLSHLLQSVAGVFGTAPSARAETQFPAGRFPALDVHQGKDVVTVKAELPGLKKEDINISLEDGVLTLSGERQGGPEHGDESSGPSRVERWFGRFQRSITLPCKVDSQNVPATYTDGILTITLSKAQEAKPRRINIEFN